MELEKFLNKSVIVPLSKSEITEIEGVLNEYIKNMDSFSVYSELTIHMLFEKIYPDFESEITSKLKTKYSPFSIREMQAYIVFETFEKEESNTIINGLILMSNLLLRRNSLKTIDHQKEIKNCIEKTIKSMSEERIPENLDCSDIYDEIFNNELNIVIEDLDDEEKEIYYSVAVKSWKYDILKWLDINIKNINENTDRLKIAFNLIEWLFDNLPSIKISRIDIPIVKLLKTIDLNDNTVVNLISLESKLSESNLLNKEREISLLLLNNSDFPEWVVDCKKDIALTELEFAIYVFYELYLNKMLEEYGEGEN